MFFLVFLATFLVWFLRSCSFVSAALLCCRRITKLEQVEQVLRREKQEVVLRSWFGCVCFAVQARSSNVKKVWLLCFGLTTFCCRGGDVVIRRRSVIELVA
jgi:hypothetical protein